MKHIAAFKFGAALLLAGTLTLPRLVEAGQYTLLFDQAISGTAPSSTEKPWLIATFADISPGVVTLTVSNLNLNGSENIDKVYFNLNPGLNPNKLNFKLLDTEGTFIRPSVSKGVDRFEAEGDGSYDIRFSLSDGHAQRDRFMDGDAFTFRITGIANLSAADFLFMSASACSPSAGPFYAASHLDRVSDCNSGWVGADKILSSQPVPEPSVNFLLSLAGAIWLAVALRRRCNQTSTALKAVRSVRPIEKRGR